MGNDKRLRDLYTEFPAELFDVIFENKSFVDIDRLDVETYEDAHNYLKNYGYDLDKLLHNEQVFSILAEAKQFIQSYLLEDPVGSVPMLVVPPTILYEDDVRNFLVMASDKDRSLTQRWACAVLRVAHTITHVENDLSKYFFQGIKKQIFSRFMDHLKVNNKGEYWLGRGKNAIQLKLFEMKNEKTKESLIMKLLHKKENVTADVFDRVGVRIVAQNKIDVLMVLKYLTKHHVISLANVKPSRTRNNILDIQQLFKGIAKLKEKDLETWSDEEVKEFLDPYTDISEEQMKNEQGKIIENNPYSSTLYTSLQITVRQLISIQDPFNIQLAYKFFFPFEIQILDYDSYVESRTGRASHDEYKKTQLLAVRKRVLNGVISYMKKTGSKKK